MTTVRGFAPSIGCSRLWYPNPVALPAHLHHEEQVRLQSHVSCGSTLSLGFLRHVHKYSLHGQSKKIPVALIRQCSRHPKQTLVQLTPGSRRAMSLSLFHKSSLCRTYIRSRKRHFKVLVVMACKRTAPQSISQPPAKQGEAPPKIEFHEESSLYA